MTGMSETTDQTQQLKPIIGRWYWYQWLDEWQAMRGEVVGVTEEHVLFRSPFTTESQIARVVERRKVLCEVAEYEPKKRSRWW